MSLPPVQWQGTLHVLPINRYVLPLISYIGNEQSIQVPGNAPSWLPVIPHSPSVHQTVRSEHELWFLLQGIILVVPKESLLLHKCYTISCGLIEVDPNSTTCARDNH